MTSKRPAPSSLDVGCRRPTWAITRARRASPSRTQRDAGSRSHVPRRPQPDSRRGAHRLRPETRYARSGDVHVAYQTLGDGPIDILFVDQWWSNVDTQWDVPPLARMLERVASFSRLILLDKRGTGLSDPVPLGGLPTLEEWMDDIRAVLDAVGSTRSALLSGVGACYLTILFAATYPERTSALVLVDGYARLLGDDDYLPSLPRRFAPQEAEAIRAGWGTGVLLSRLAPSEAGDPAVVQAFAAYERQSASPGTATAMLNMLYQGDVRQVLPTIRIPTMVMAHARSARIPVAHSEYLAENIAGARYVELP